jgi:hypothetical protein
MAMLSPKIIADSGGIVNLTGRGSGFICFLRAERLEDGFILNDQVFDIRINNLVIRYWAYI